MYVFNEIGSLMDESVFRSLIRVPRTCFRDKSSLKCFKIYAADMTRDDISRQKC